MGMKLAVILGSGVEIDKSRINNIDLIKGPEISGIHRKLVYTCKYNGRDLLVISGRKHFYEGFKYDELLSNIALASECSAEYLIITNAAGGVNDNFNVSDLMLIRSHVNLNSALIYKQSPFPYDAELSELFVNACAEAGVMLHEGVYGYYQGPTYETKAEIRFQKKFNIDAAGMSTVPEIGNAHSRGIKTIGVSVITNLLNENASQTASHDDVLISAAAASAGLNKTLNLLLESISGIH
jgi:purine-nucleoside phosphorylase